MIRGTILPGLMVVIGVALIVKTLMYDGEPTSIGIILGILFLAAGAGRLYVERHL